MSKIVNEVKQQIPSLFVDIDSYSTFQNLKRAYDESNTSYIIGDSDEPIEGTPDIMWDEVAFIKDSKYIYARKILFCKPENGFDILEYGDDIESITDEHEREIAKLNYVIDNFVNVSTGSHDIRSARAKKVIKLSDLHSKQITFGGFPVEMRSYVYNGPEQNYQKYIFKVTMQGYMYHPDKATIYDTPKDYYFEYEVAWEDREGEWVIGDLVFHKKYSKWFFDMSNLSYGAPKYILRLFDDRYSDKELKHKIKSEVRRLTKNIKIVSANKCTMQSPYIRSGESSLICTCSEYHMPIYVLNSEGVLQDSLGNDFEGVSPLHAQGITPRNLTNYVDQIAINITDYFLLEKFTIERDNMLQVDEHFYCMNMNSSIYEAIQNSPIPYVFVRAKQPVYNGEMLNSGALIAVHVNNIIANGGMIEGIYNTINAKYSIYLAVPNSVYTGCVITNTASMPICTNKISNNYTVHCYGLEYEAYIHHRYGKEFVRVKKDMLHINPVTLERYIDANEVHKRHFFKDALSENAASITRMTSNYYTDLNCFNKTLRKENTYAISIKRLFEVLGQPDMYTSFVYCPSHPTTYYKSTYRWNRFLFNKRGNIKTGSLVYVGSETITQDQTRSIIPGYAAPEEENQVNQNSTWNELFDECGNNYMFAAALYMLNNVFGVRVDEDNSEYVYTKFGALDAVNGITTKYCDIAIYYNYIRKVKNQSLQRKHERRGILVRLTLNEKFVKEEDFSSLINIINEMNAGNIDIFSAMNDLFTVKIIGNIDFPRNLVGSQEY